jgi:hypothetical protein
LRSSASYRSRIFDRHRFDLRVKLVIHRHGRPDVVHGRTRDLSFSGMGVVLSREIATGTACLLILKFPKTDIEVQLPAIVAYGRGFHCGFEFQKLTGQQKLLIQKICKALPA